MWNPFKKAKEKKLRIAQIIKSEVKLIEQRVDDISMRSYLEYKKYKDKYDNICPSCKSTNVNDRIKRQQGEINGYGSGSIFGYSSSIHGEWDTNSVNKCNDCGNEWKKYAGSYVSSYKYLKKNIFSLYCSNKKYNEIKNMTFDPLDPKEIYNSLEEKIEVHKRYEFTGTYFKEKIEVWKGISLHTFEYLMRDKDEWFNYNKEFLLTIVGMEDKIK